MTPVNLALSFSAYAQARLFAARRRILSLSTFQSMFLPVLAGLILLTIGFNKRENNSGVLMMWLGMLSILGIMVWKILEKLD
ncbi:hypothetical protein AYO28_04725 [Pseudomonas putida]|uniref:Uncharacterized protein n=1 Tax=Pseudomonas putida TaxID=303 RepID=A0A177SB64_PSEPU|nr:hypothetical protein AYO28_04725 [Pseudomonas putida]